MPLTLPDYANVAFYQEGVDNKGTDIQGKELQFWVQNPAAGSSIPAVRTISVETAVVADDEEMSVSADVAVRLYRGDVLKFSNGVLVVIKTTTLIGTSATDLPILPATGAIADTATAITYGLIPVLSLADGGLPEITGQETSRRNRGELFQVKRIVGRDYSIQCNGRYVKNDTGIWIVSDASDTTREIYWQSRYAPYIVHVDQTGTNVTEGRGPIAYAGSAFVQNFSMPATSENQQEVTCTLMGSGGLTKYAPLVA